MAQDFKEATRHQGKEALGVRTVGGPPPQGWESDYEWRRINEQKL